jgi:hypothetical protein
LAGSSSALSLAPQLRFNPRNAPHMKKLLLPLFVILVCLVCDTSPRAITAATNLSPLPGSQLDNISTRAFVQTGDNVMIGGFIIQGTEPKTVTSG